MYSLILSDIDGTLLKDDLTISKNTILALDIARAKGIRIVLCSGRYIQGISFLANELGLQDPIFSAINGSLVKDGGKYVFQKTLEKEIYEKAIKIVSKRAKSVIAFSESRYAIDSDIKWYRLQDRICKQKGILMDLSSYDSVQEALCKPIYKILVKDDDKSIIDMLKKELENKMDKDATILSSSSTNLEILPFGSDKKNTVDILERYLSIDRNDMIAFGDWDNDAGMLSSVGMGIAMANGSDKAKKSAKIITKDNNSDGISYALKNLLKII